MVDTDNDDDVVLPDCWWIMTVVEECWSGLQGQDATGGGRGVGGGGSLSYIIVK